jgi:hypothetical protein
MNLQVLSTRSRGESMIKIIFLGRLVSGLISEGNGK